jgi:hypothetical protein
VAAPPEINRADRTGVVHALMRAIQKGQSWLPAANPYVADTVRKIKAGALQPAALADYIAISAPLHCADGWSYVGRALESHLHNDTDTCRHLAYYAELRAALSLLAAEGVGIFNTRHFVVLAAGDADALPWKRGTHEVAAEALEWWAAQASARSLLGRVVRPADILLETWAQAFSPGTTLAPVARELLLEWGLDLKRVGLDRQARNEASYRPTRVVPRSELTLPASLDFCRDWWQMFEPVGLSRFGTIDQFLLRRTLHFLSSAFPTNPQQQYRLRIPATVSSALAHRPDLHDEYERFLMQPDVLPPLLQAAQGTDGATHPQHHLQVISRASLLLRLATGASQRLLLDAGIKPSDVTFWIDDLAARSGLWADGSDKPDEPTDLYDDVTATLERLDDLRSRSAPAVTVRPAWARQTELCTAILGGSERVPVWCFA